MLIGFAQPVHSPYYVESIIAAWAQFFGEDIDAHAFQALPAS
jgi:hypothetical protein